MNYKEALIDFAIDLIDYYEVFTMDFQNGEPVEKDAKENAVKQGMHPSILAFYDHMDGYSMQWDLIDPVDPDICGRVNMMSLEKVLTDWEGDLYDEDTSKDSDLLRFHPIDLFTEETHVGIFFEGDKSKEMYLHAYGDDEIYPLYLDLEGYITMMIAAKGFLYWQMAILEMTMGRESVEADRFKTEMPKIFKDFSYKKFVQKFEALKIKV